MSQNHHYVPVFYLKRWVGKDSKLCVYVRPRDRVKPYWMHPDGTGYKEDLYAISGADAETAKYLEGCFLNLRDSRAAMALDMLETGRITSMDADQRSAWSRFLMRLLHGNPEAVDRISGEAEEMLRANFAPLANDKEHVARTKVAALQTLMDSKLVGEHLNRMAWVVVPLRSSYSLLTSDRPLLMTNGISGPGKHLGMPIGPRLLFIAADDPAEVQQLARQDHDVLAMVTNDGVVSQARKFVWGIDDSHLRFVEQGLGEMAPSSPLEA